MDLGDRIKEIEIIDYSGGCRNITKFLDDAKNTAFLKVEIDRNNIVKMAERFYNENGAKNTFKMNTCNKLSTTQKSQ
jgi:hypothetical protein